MTRLAVVDRISRHRPFPLRMLRSPVVHAVGKHPWCAEGARTHPFYKCSGTAIQTGVDARILSELATEELAATEFDASYAPTEHGRRLEDIIDALVDI